MVVESLETMHAIRRQQDEEYAESLRIDQEKDRERACQEEESLRAFRLEMWYDRIHRDLALSLAPEPPAGTPDMVRISVRMPDRQRVSRCFHSSDDVKKVFSYVGSQPCVNPRHFRLLLSIVPVLVEFQNKGTIGLLGLSRLTLLTAENLEVASGEKEVVSGGSQEPDSLDVGSEDLVMPGDGNECASGRRENSPLSNINSDHRDSSPTSVYSGYRNGSLMSHGSVTVIDLTHTDPDKFTLLLTLQNLEDTRLEIKGDLVQNGTKHICISRLSVFNDLVSLYQEDSNIAKMGVSVEFKNEGLDSGGLTRELFAAFWQQAELLVFEGCSEKVPSLTPESATLYNTIGQILGHGFVLTGFIPLYFSKCLMMQLLCAGNACISDDDLLQSFLAYVDVPESMAIKECLSASPKQSVMVSVVIPMLSRFNCSTKPTTKNLKHLLYRAAHFALVCQPCFAIVEMKHSLFKCFPKLAGKCDKHVINEEYGV